MLQSTIFYFQEHHFWAFFEPIFPLSALRGAAPIGAKEKLLASFKLLDFLERR